MSKALQETLKGLTVVQLKDIARSNKIRGYSRLRKHLLIQFLMRNLSAKVLKKSLTQDKCIARSKVTLRPHQIAVVKYFASHRGLVAAFDVGSGKTLAAIAASQCALRDAPRTKKKKLHVFVITPKSLRENFRKEMVKYGLDANDPNYTLYTSTQFYYASKRGEIDCSNTFLIVDEAHNLKRFLTKTAITEYLKTNVPSSIALSVIHCAMHAWKVLLLTATPAPNRTFDILNLVAMVRGELPLAKRDLKFLLNDDHAFRDYFQCLFSFYKPLKSKDYPKVIHVGHGKVEIEMTSRYYKEYMKLEEGKDIDINPWIFYVGLRMGSNVIKTCVKCDYVMDVVEKGQKTLIYSAFKSKGIEVLERRLKKKKIPYVVVSGDIPEKQRKINVEVFNDTEGPNVLFITKAGAEGLDLVGTRHVIIFESVWNVDAEEQIVGRAARFHSHSHLPPSQRNVREHKLVVVKPKARRKKDIHPSADVMLRDLSKTKYKDTKALIDKLNEVSIENMDC